MLSGIPCLKRFFFAVFCLPVHRIPGIGLKTVEELAISREPPIPEKELDNRGQSLQ